MKISKRRLRKIIYESLKLDHSDLKYSTFLNMLTSNKQSSVSKALYELQYLYFEKNERRGRGVIEVPVMTSIVEPGSIKEDESGRVITAKINYPVLGYHLSITSRQRPGSATYVRPVPYTMYTGDPSDYPLTFEFSARYP